MNIKKILSIPIVYSFFRKIVGSDKARQRYADQFIKAPVGSNVLDIGCGTGDILEFLPYVNYVGFDISPHYIECAKRRFGERGQFFCQPVDDKINVKESSFDRVIAHGVLHHLNDYEAVSMFMLSYQSLKRGGCLLTFDGCLTDEQSFLAKYFVSHDRGQFVRTVAGYESLAQKVFQEVAVTIRHDMIRLPYTHIIMECRK